MKKWSRHLLAAGALALGMSAAHADDNNTLYFYNWTEYVPPGLLEQFTKETGIKVIYSTYESNETMYAKLKTYKDGAYDLVVPSTYYVDKMRKEGMIQKIDKSKLSNFSNLDPDMLNKPFDPNNDYSIPYIWGATAIGVNGDAVDPKSVTSWADLWKPEYKGSLLLTDDAREVFQMALRKLGYSGNTTDPKEIEAAYNELKKLMPNVAAFNSDNPANPYMEGEVNLGMVWNGSAYVARQAAEILGLAKGQLEPGYDADFVLVDLDTPYTVDKDKLHSKSHNCPFDGAQLYGRVFATVKGGELTYQAEA